MSADTDASTSRGNPFRCRDDALGLQAFVFIIGGLQIFTYRVCRAVNGDL